MNDTDTADAEALAAVAADLRATADKLESVARIAGIAVVVLEWKDGVMQASVCVYGSTPHLLYELDRLKLRMLTAD